MKQERTFLKEDVTLQKSQRRLQNVLWVQFFLKVHFGRIHQGIVSVVWNLSCFYVHDLQLICLLRISKSFFRNFVFELLRLGLIANVCRSSISIEGYMSLRLKTRNGEDDLCRRYFVLSGSIIKQTCKFSSIYWSFCAFFFWSPWIGCLLYFYNSRGAFQPDSSNPVSSRPLDISGFVVSGISVESPYTITLSPIDREDVRQSFELLCDTIHEMRCLEFLYAL